VCVPVNSRQALRSPFMVRWLGAGSPTVPAASIAERFSQGVTVADGPMLARASTSRFSEIGFGANSCQFWLSSGVIHQEICVAYRCETRLLGAL
jgi:hypothetical protein